LLHYETDDAFIEEQYMRRLGCLFAIGMMWLCIVDCFSQGLLFYGNEKRISERATYSVLREGHERTFTNAFRISFDYLVRNVESPGYILYLEDRDAGKTYSFTYLHKPGDRCSFSFNEDGKRIFCTFELDKEDYDHRWLPVSIALDIPTDCARITIGKRSKEISNLGLEPTGFSPHIYFGKCEYILDVASYAIRNLSLTDGEEIMSTSPETLVRLENGRLTTFPVAGSRPRGTTPEEDKVLEKDLLSDEKELSEHNMLVDLGRNDLGKISNFDSVEVTKYMMIHRYSKIMHICSQVESNIRSNCDGLSAIESVLPAGTLSGAPKIRACEIIEELESEQRGIYGGALGYLDFTGNLDTCIAIRMAVKKDGHVYVQAGSGIVADSIPENEYMESYNKALAVMNAVKNAKEVLE